jgi:hypothetical protein
MKKYLVLLLLITIYSTTAQTIKLNYVPQGIIVKFNFNKLTLYTDTNSLFSINNTSPISDKINNQRIRNLIIKTIKNDTAVFTGSFINFDDSITTRRDDTYWRVWLALRQLTKENKLVIIDSAGKKVKKIKIKKQGRKRDCWYVKVFINKETKEELFVYQEIHLCSGIVWFY